MTPTEARGASGFTPMQECLNCGQLVSERFARVFGDNEGRLNGCVHCLTNRSLYEGAAGGAATPTPAPEY